MITLSVSVQVCMIIIQFFLFYSWDSGENETICHSDSSQLLGVIALIEKNGYDSLEASEVAFFHQIIPTCTSVVQIIIHVL